jgi:hypothetical protein
MIPVLVQNVITADLRAVLLHVFGGYFDFQAEATQLYESAVLLRWHVDACDLEGVNFFVALPARQLNAVSCN